MTTGVSCPTCGGIEELHHLRSGSKRFEFHFCPRCGAEWTVTIENEPDPLQPISSEEILTLHDKLSDPDVKLDDL